MYRVARTYHLCGLRPWITRTLDNKDIVSLAPTLQNIPTNILVVYRVIGFTSEERGVYLVPVHDVLSYLGRLVRAQ